MSASQSNRLARLLSERPFLLADGATGTNLFDMGLLSGDAPELWNVDHVDRIESLHRSMIAAGADIILTNTFGGSRYRLKLHKAEARVAELNELAARIARRMADETLAKTGREIVVAGDIGPSGELFEPLGPLTLAEEVVTVPGTRYIDFLVPGLLGFGLMSSSVWGLGWAIVQMRMGKLLRRLAATPMRKLDFLLAFATARLLLAFLEVLFFLGFARLIFDVRVAGNPVTFVVWGLLGGLSFGGLSALVASRAENSETASGLMNLVTLPMTVVSGVFFSSSHFPGWLQPVLRALPLTALIDGLRAISIDGAGVTALVLPALVLLVWGVGSFALALRTFRWT